MKTNTSHTNRIASILRTSLVASLAVSMGACSQGNLTSTEYQSIQKSLTDVGQGNVTAPKGKGTCELIYADYNLNAKIIGFELTSDNKIGIGFNSTGNFNFGVSGSFKAKKSTMQTVMNFADPFSKVRPDQKDFNISTALAESTMNEKQIGAEINFAFIKLGFESYKKDPLFKVTEAGIRAAVDENIKLGYLANYEKEVKWRTTVSKIQKVGKEIYAFIPTGTVAGLVVGDKFKFTNVETIWKGEPCSSPVVHAMMPKTEEPIAWGTVTIIEGASAAVRLDAFDPSAEDKLEEGAVAQIDQLYNCQDKCNRTLKRSLRITDASAAGVFEIKSTGEKIDVGPYLKAQLEPILRGYNYYVQPN